MSRIVEDEMQPKTLRESNTERLQALIAAGYPLLVFQLAAVQTALDVLTEQMLPSGPPRKKFDLALDRQIEELIVTAEREVMAAKEASAGLILPT